jgi:hypothetical protein
MKNEEIFFNVSYAFYDILDTMQEWEHILSRPPVYKVLFLRRFPVPAYIKFRRDNTF